MPLQVVIAGAGISGLCTAVALHQNGHSVKAREFKGNPNSLKFGRLHDI